MAAEHRNTSPEQEGRLLAERLGGRWGANGGLCRCPAHDDRNPSLSVRSGRTRLLLHCFAGCSARDVLRALGRERLLDPQAAEESRWDAATRAPNVQNLAARNVWDQSRSIAGTSAAAYLKARGLASDSPELRYHPRTPDGAYPLTRFRPALIAAVRDDCGLTGIHRTFLDATEGGQHVQKKALGRLGSGAVRLGNGLRLGLAEGIETALSAAFLFDVPCWATLGTERFDRVALPAGTEELLLFVDHDAGGDRAAALARTAFAHVKVVTVHRPRDPGDDWNDVLRAHRA